MKMRKFSAAVIGLCTLLAACSGQPAKSSDRGLFTPLPRDGGLKLFEYQLRVELPPAKPIRHSVDANRPQPREKSDDELLKQAQRLLSRDSRLQEYCPLGYITLEQYAVLNALKIRGECRYTAPAKDGA
ncbi:hypothetical protein [Spongiibacter sp.]|uniref:hypothetical protein n=1 Tax=Spongiibacter sp. TaxID=2024860 RepID=UPI0035624354